MTDPFDVVVVGGGLMGSAAAWSLTRRGRSVLLVEQFGPGHAQGSSHGSARIVRRAYGDATYARLTGQSFELWRELEVTSGEQVLRLHGGLDFGAQRRVPDVARHLADAAVPREVLSAAEAEARWPGMRFEGEVVFHAQAGVLDAARAIDAFLAQARARGADVRFAAPVTQLVPSAAGVIVRFSDGSCASARVVVVAAGAWVGDLLRGLVDLPPLRISEQSIFHFPRRDTAQAPWPSTIHEGHGRAAYHLAGGRDGGPGDDRKVGLHDLGPPITPATRAGRPDAALRDTLTRYVRDWLPGLVPTPRGGATCLYTVTPTEDFVLDRVGPIVVCSPCSGHGAKFAPLVGELVAELVDGTAGVPNRFRLAAHAAARIGSVSL